MFVCAEVGGLCLCALHVCCVCVFAHYGGVVLVWGGGCVCRSVGLQAVRGGVRTQICRLCCVWGCCRLFACSVCVGGDCRWGGVCVCGALCACGVGVRVLVPPACPVCGGAAGCAHSWGVQFAVCVCVCVRPVGAAASGVPPIPAPQDPAGLRGGSWGSLLLPAPGTLQYRGVGGGPLQALLC